MLLKVVCYAQKNKQCDALLLSKFKSVDKCGIVKVVEKLKFKVIQNGVYSNDTAIFFVLCPSDYPDDFWELGKMYHVEFEKKLSTIKSSVVIDGLTKKDRRYKIGGVVLNASKD